MVTDPNPVVDTLAGRLRQALPRAMKARDAAAVSALRTTLAAIANAEAVAAPDPPPGGSGPIAGARSGVGAGEATRLALTEDQIAGIVRAEIDERRSAADEYRRVGQADEADRLGAEAAVLQAHLRET